jgi:bifunctional non-homologous end joining protein LigD
VTRKCRAASSAATSRRLLYTAQLAAISQDPWFSRVQSPSVADHCAIDLDPMPGVKFRACGTWRFGSRRAGEIEGPRLLEDLRRQRHTHLHSASRGHAIRGGTDLLPDRRDRCRETHPKVATIIRSVHARGQKVYVDYLQNIEGKSLASAYSARASEFAGASTPLTWREIEDGLDPRDFTINTLPGRLAQVGDLWAPLLSSKGVDLRELATI